jgi:hypothetical protein
MKYFNVLCSVLKEGNRNFFKDQGSTYELELKYNQITSLLTSN